MALFLHGTSGYINLDRVDIIKILDRGETFSVVCWKNSFVYDLKEGFKTWKEAEEWIETVCLDSEQVVSW